MPNTDLTLVNLPIPAPSSSPPLCTLTMYDLPSEDPEEPGLPDEFHCLQPQLLARTLRLVGAIASQVFSASDLNLYYDPLHPLWHKRPDWFLVVGVPRLYQSRDLRDSYVIWDEQVSPLLVVEFLSPGTEAEDLGRFYEGKTVAKSPQKKAAKNRQNLTVAGPDAEAKPQPPAKFVVYEEILKVLNYVVYDRRNQSLRHFRLINGRYQEQELDLHNPRLWIPELALGLGLWEGVFEGVDHTWLRWCDREGDWCLTDTEQERTAKEQERTAKEQERTAKEQERTAKEQERMAKEAVAAELAEERRLRQILAERLRSMGIDPESLA